MSDPDFLKSLCVGPDTTVMEATAVLTRSGKKIVLVVDGDMRLLGVVTDFDIRNAILEHVDFDAPVERIMQSKPTVAFDVATEQQLLDIIAESRVFQLPVIDKDRRLKDILFLDEFMHLETRHDRREAVIMAGGLGTRLRPMTEHTPKPLLEVGGRPILFILIDQLLSENFDRIHVTLNYKSEMIMESIGSVPKYRDKVDFVVETEPLGTAGSLRLIEERPKGPFVVMNADLVTNVSLVEMLNFHKNSANAVTVATKRHSHTIPYGVVELDEARVTGMREKPTTVYFLNTGVYVLDPAVLDDIPEHTFIDMTDVVGQCLETDRRVGSFPVHEYWIDIGSHDQYAKVQREYPDHFAGETE